MEENLCGVYSWDQHNIFFYFESFNCNQTLNANLYSQQLQSMHENLRKLPKFINRRNMLLHDNARPHSARIMQEKILGLGWTVLPDSSCTKWFPSFLFSTKFFEWQRIFSRRSSKIICEKLLELECSWILLERNQQVNW